MEFFIYLIGTTILEYLLARGISMQTVMTVMMSTGATIGILSRLPWRRMVIHVRNRRQAKPVTAPPFSEDSLRQATPQTQTDEAMNWNITSKRNGTEIWEIGDGQQNERHRIPGDESEVAFLKRRLEEELHAKWAAQRLILEPPAARIAGRVARIEPHDPEATHKALWLAFPDDEGNNQAVKVRGLVGDLSLISERDGVQVALTWKYGRLTLAEIEDHVTADLAGPMPEVKLPEPNPKGTVSKDGKLPTMDELDKAAREGEWGSLNHSVYRFQVPVHITMCPKYRAKSFEGRATEVQAICREVAETEGFSVIAIAAESDHIHLLGIPSGAGGMPPTWIWSRWVGRFKALTSKRLKSLTGLEDFQWQTGYAITSVNGGRQSSEESLDVVKRYVMSQGHQDES